MAQPFASWIEAYLAPAPLPPGTTSRELVFRALGRRRPERIPYSFFEPLESDFFELALVEEQLDREERCTVRRPPGTRYRDAWGVGRCASGARWDHAVAPAISDLRELARYRPPEVAPRRRFERLRPWVERGVRAGKFCVGFDPVGLFTRAVELVGFGELLEACYTDPDRVGALLDLLAALVLEAVDRWSELGGIDAFMTWEDWGFEHGLPIRLERFLALFAPRYARIASAVHARGMRYVWHSCGAIAPLIPELAALGVDVLQLDEPRRVGHRRLAREFGERLSFWNAVDLPWSLQPDRRAAEIEAEVAAMVEPFRARGGGFLARQIPWAAEAGLEPARQRLIHAAFLSHGCALPGRCAAGGSRRARPPRSP